MTATVIVAIEMIVLDSGIDHLLPPEICRKHYRLNFLYLIRCGMIESIPSRRFLSSS